MVYNKAINWYWVQTARTEEQKLTIRSVMRCAIWYNLYNLKKREKHTWRSATFSKVAGCIKTINSIIINTQALLKRRGPGYEVVTVALN